MRTITRLTAALALIALAVGAGTSLAGPPDKPTPVTLTLQTPSGPGRPASVLAEAFAGRAKALSEGGIRINVVYPRVTLPKTWPWLRQHLDDVTSGRVQLATVWGGSLELAGVKTVRALYAPFRLRTKSAAAAATSGPIAAKTLEGFAGTGLTGLALAPQGLARIFGGKRPLVSAADFAGARIRTPYGPASVTALNALGARPVDIGGNFSGQLASGALPGNEISWAIGSSYLASSKTAANVVLYPLVDVIVANDAAFGRLGPERQAILRTAAAQARELVIQRWDERKEARAFCAAGGTIVDATPAQVRALERKGAAVEALYARDRATAAILPLLRRLPAGTSDRVATCAAQRAPKPGPRPDPGPVATATLPPPGTYRTVLDPAVMRAAGATAEDIRRNAGTHTMRIDGTTGNETGQNPNYTFTCDFRLKIEGRFVRMDFAPSSECGGDPWYFTWTLDGQNLVVTFYDGIGRKLTSWERLYGGRWERVG